MLKTGRNRVELPESLKVQCWEFIKCGREKDLSCPAVTQQAGRRCWLTAGTLCGDVARCDHAVTLTSCMECTFYIYIKLIAAE